MREIGCATECGRPNERGYHPAARGRDGSGECVEVCAYEDAITLQTMGTDGHTAQKAVVTPANCVGCGVCVSACPNHAIDVQGWTLAQYDAMLDAIAAPLPVLESAL